MFHWADLQAPVETRGDAVRAAPGGHSSACYPRKVADGAVVFVTRRVPACRAFLRRRREGNSKRARASGLPHQALPGGPVRTFRRADQSEGGEVSQLMAQRHVAQGRIVCQERGQHDASRRAVGAAESSLKPRRKVHRDRSDEFRH